MAKLPRPPPAAQLAALGPDIVRIAAGTRWWRVYFRASAHPTTWSALRSFGPTNSRFDHHPDPPALHPGHQILYAALDGLTALAEVFQKGGLGKQRTIDRTQDSPWLVGFELAADLELLDLTGNWPTRAGASQAISTGRRDLARLWSRAIHSAFPTLHGLQYRSSMHAGLPAFALYERGAPALPSHPVFHRALLDPALDGPLRNAAASLNYRLL